MAQATIDVEWDGNVNILELPADGSLDNGLTVSQFPFQSFNQGEQHIVDENVIDDVLDVFYIEGVAQGNNEVLAVAYIKSQNQTGDPKGHNFIVMNAETVDGQPSGPFTLGHEAMHILLNSPDRDQQPPVDPSTALFYKFPSQSDSIGATKRIGPHEGTEPPDAAGDDDTFSIRAVAEALP